MQFESKPFQLAAHSSGAGLKLGRRECLALSQLAALHGHVVSYREFGQLAKSLNGQTLGGVTLAGQLTALWQAQFPKGRVWVANWPPNPEEIPALWLGPKQTTVKTQVMLVLGAQTNGNISCLDEHGRLRDLPASIARQGCFLTMEADLGSATQDQPSEQKPNTSPSAISCSIVAALLKLLIRR